MVSRVLLRGRKLRDLQAVLFLYVATAVSAVFFIYTFPRLRFARDAPTPLGWSTTVGVCLAALYSTQHLARCRDVLTYPVVQRHRYFRVKRRLPQVLLVSFKLGALALLLALLQARRLVAASALLQAALAASLCAAGWLLGHTMLQVVFTERHKLSQAGDPDPNRPLLQALSSDNPVVQDLALIDLACMTEEVGALACQRRAALFADETGRLGWTPVGGYLLSEVRDLVTALAAALPAISGEAAAAGTAGGKGHRVQWNMLSLSPSTGASLLGREQDMAAWSVRSKYYRLGWCLRALSSLAAVSRKEDRYGVVLLCDPNLADIIMGLLSTILVLQQYTRITSMLSCRSSGALSRVLSQVADLLGGPPHPSLQQVEHLASALEDTARGATYRVINAFGSSLKNSMREAKMKPAYGTPTDLNTLLAAFLAYQE